MKKIKLTGKHGIGKFALVDNELFEELNNYTWYLDSVGYPRRTYVDKYGSIKTIRMHKQIAEDSREGFVIDHINRNKLDNRVINLRSVSQAINCFNKNKQSNNSSGIVGVSFDKKWGKWRAQLSFNKVELLDEFFDTMEDAKLARRRVESKLEVQIAERPR